MWQTVAAISTLGWCLSLIYLWRKRAPKPAGKTASGNSASEKKAYGELIRACERGNSSDARAAVIAWAATVAPEATARSLEQVADTFGDEEFRQQLNELDAALYRRGDSNWDGNALAACVRRVRKEKTSRHRSTDEADIQLYPSTL